MHGSFKRFLVESSLSASGAWTGDDFVLPTNPKTILAVLHTRCCNAGSR
jgi:hypothetical protein